MLNPRRVLTRAQILDHVWDYDFGGDARVLETYISYLRKKIDVHGPPLIHTVRGVGYALRAAAGVMRVAADPARRRRCWRWPRSACCCSAAITYAEQRSFLLDRVDQQAERGAGVPSAVSAACRSSGGTGPPPGRAGRRRRRPATGLPPGTYGSVRDADGDGRSARLSATTGPPRAPDAARATRAPGRSPTIGSNSDDAATACYARRARVRTASTVVAVPLTEVDATLAPPAAHRGDGDRWGPARARPVAWAGRRIGLRPLERIGATAGAIAAGDLSRRVEPGGAAHRGRPPRPRPERDARAARAGVRQAPGEPRIGCARFLADASHELRTPLASIRGYAELFRIGAARDPGRHREGDAPDRVRGGADGRAGRGPADARAAGRGRATEPRREVDLAALAGDAVDDARATAPDREIDLAPAAHGPCSAIRTNCARSSPT